jgi:hypothetical protein
MCETAPGRHMPFSWSMVSFSRNPNSIVGITRWVPCAVRNKTDPPGGAHDAVVVESSSLLPLLHPHRRLARADEVLEKLVAPGGVVVGERLHPGHGLEQVEAHGRTAAR